MGNCFSYDSINIKAMGTKMIAKSGFNRPDCITINKNDVLEIIEGGETDEFLLVKNNTTGEKGYAPRLLLVYEMSLESEDWYYGAISRAEVTSQYLTESVKDGTFLIRKTNKNYPYALSVKTTIDGQCVVKHYRIFNNENHEFYISPEAPFTTLADLVEKYTYNDYNICCKLTEPCHKAMRPNVYSLSPLYSLNWEIPRAEVEIGDKIGSGQFSNVYTGTWKDKKVAIKKVTACTEEEILNEIGIMKKLRHRNIAVIFGYCQTEPKLIVTEYMEYGDLKQYLQKTQLLLKDLIYICFQIADGMDYLSSRNIVHRDLAARNLLVGEDLVIKISDFGLSRQQNERGVYIIKNQNVKLAAKWMAPEALDDDEITSKSDVWSYGIVLVEVFTKGVDPYPKYHDLYQLKKKIDFGYRMERPDEMPKNIYKKCLLCWNTDPLERPTFASLKSFFEDYNC